MRDDNGQLVIPSMGSNPVKSKINTFGGRLSLTPNRQHDIVLDVETGRQTYDNSRGQMGTLGTGGYASDQKYNRDQWSLAHTGRYGFGVWDTSYMVNKTETIGRLIPPGVPGAGGPRTLETTSKVLDTKLVMPWGNHLTTVGGQYWKAKMVDGVAPDQFDFTQKALFAEDEWSLAETFKLTLGGRYDRHSSFGSKFSPRIYGVWSAAPQWTIKGGVSNGYKTPRVEQLTPGINGFGSQGKLPLIGSPGLKPETSRSTELGIHFDDAQNSGFAGGVTLFNNKFKDKIATGEPVPNCSWATSPNQPGCVDVGNWPLIAEFGQSINIDSAVTRGVELNARYAFNKQWSASGNYTYTKSEQKSGASAGQPLTDTPKNAVNLRVDWKPNAQWSAWARAEYRSERYRGNPATNAAAKALGDYKAYTQFHVGGSYRVTPQFVLNGAIYNLFNKNFVDYAGYQNGASIAYANRYRNPQEGRRLWVSGTYEF